MNVLYNKQTAEYANYDARMHVYVVAEGKYPTDCESG